MHHNIDGFVLPLSRSDELLTRCFLPRFGQGPSFDGGSDFLRNQVFGKRSAGNILAGFVKNGVLYANASGIVTNSSGLTWDGTAFNVQVAGLAQLNAYATGVANRAFLLAQNLTDGTFVQFRACGSTTPGSTGGQLNAGGIQLSASPLAGAYFTIGTLAAATIIFHYNSNEHLRMASGRDTFSVPVYVSEAAASGQINFNVEDSGGWGFYVSQNNTFNFNRGQNADTTGYLNWVGYNNGTTKYRSTVIGNGKSAAIATFDGPTSNVTFAGTITSTNMPVGPSSTMFGNLLAATVGISSTNYFGPGDSATTTTETNARNAIPYAATIKNFYLRTSTAQPATGSLVFTILKNGSATAVTFTIAAGGAAALFSDTTHSFSVAAGDEISISVLNNGLALSAAIQGWSFQMDRT